MSSLRANGSVIGKNNAPSFTSSKGVWDLRTAFLAILGDNWQKYLANYFGTGADGDVTISANTDLPSTLDGDVVVKNYNNLTINSGCKLTVANRCKGLLLYVKGDLVVNGELSMTARGASVNPTTAGVSATGLRIVRFKTGATDTLSASDLAGCGSAATTAEGNQAGISGNGKIYTIARTGASGGAAVTDAGGSGVAGNQGGDGSTGQSGGGASGGARWFSGPSGRGGNGTCFSGGPGGGATNNGVTDGVTAGSDTGGAGGNACTGGASGSGAGNPAGSNGTVGENGTGGLLILIVRGNVTIGATGIISADGKLGGSAQSSGGASGGGNILLLRGGTYSNSGSVRANGGSAAPSLGGRGGNGSVQVDQINAS